MYCILQIEISSFSSGHAQVQLMTGVSPILFWSANIIWDGLLFLVSAIFFITALIALDDRLSFSSNGATGEDNFKCDYFLPENS